MNKIAKITAVSVTFNRSAYPRGFSSLRVSSSSGSGHWGGEGRIDYHSY
jgi:hypothetical protein